LKSLRASSFLASLLLLLLLLLLLESAVCCQSSALLLPAVVSRWKYADNRWLEPLYMKTTHQRKHQQQLV
jgi:hypothetical protein